MVSVAEMRPAKFGFAGFVLGVISVLIVMVQLSSILEPVEQGPSAGQVIGEIAAEIKQSAQRALSGEPAPEPEPVTPDYGQYIIVGAMCLATIAVILGGIGLYRHEPHRLSYLAVGFGISAFVMQYVFWLALLICGIVLLVSIIGNLDSIVGG
ncbi:MAG: hypothetical protein HKP37_07775 [Boseongicola sp.]|nr:hypothetical protein [Boseongicola sp.]NNL18622.1 hypothetical protein [Boseongicola sp.]